MIAIRYLEDAKLELDKSIDKTWFICCNYLVAAYAKLHEAESYAEYESQAKVICKQVLANASHAKNSGFKIARFRREFASFIGRD